jgi:hypothetical protein
MGHDDDPTGRVCPTSGPTHRQVFSTAPGLTLTAQRRALMQKASSQYAAECEESEKKAELEWEEKQAVARAQAAKKEKAAKDKETAKEQKKREKEQKRVMKALMAEQKAMKKEHSVNKTKKANKRRAQEGNEERPKKKKRVAKIYCTCRGPAGRKPMIGCDGCREWYHFDCLGIDKEEEITALQLEDGYMCPTCQPGVTLL